MRTINVLENVTIHKKFLSSTEGLTLCPMCNGYTKSERLKSFEKNVGDLTRHPLWKRYVENVYKETPTTEKTTTFKNFVKEEEVFLKQDFLEWELPRHEDTNCPYCVKSGICPTSPIGFEVTKNKLMHSKICHQLAIRCGFLMLWIDSTHWLIPIREEIDFTWSLAHCQYVLQGYLTREQMANMSVDGYKYLTEGTRKRIVFYLKSNMRTPEQYELEYAETISGMAG